MRHVDLSPTLVRENYKKNIKIDARDLKKNPLYVRARV
jgi:hypothetical protein